MRRDRLAASWSRSLGRRVLLAVAVPLALLVVIGAAIDYASARRLTDEAHDRALTSLAVGLSARLEAEGDGDLGVHLPQMVDAAGRQRADDRLDYAVLSEGGALMAGDPVLARLATPDSPPTRLFTATLGGQQVRVVEHRYVGPDARVTILVAETTHGRRAEARRLLYVTAATNLVIAALAVAAGLVAVRVAMRPLNLLKEGLEVHGVAGLRPIPLATAPTEAIPLVRAINRLMSRVRTSADARQAFISDTAHQLRTPLAQLSAQAGLLGEEALPPVAAARVAQLRESVDRLSRLAHQMLALARADGDGAPPLPQEPVDLSALLTGVGNACLDTALARAVDLGFDPQPARVLGSPWMLREQLLNLVDNAIRHSPPGSTVTVRCGQVDGRAFLEVEDDGPGIPAGQRQRVLERFVRLGDAAQGSGLGLAIVREIADRHEADLRLSDGPGGRGLRVTVSFPPGRSSGV